MNPLERAQELIRSGRTPEALSALDTLVRDPQHGPSVLGHRAWLLRSLGRYDDAVRDYDALLAAVPSDGEAAILRAETLLLAGRPEESVAGIRDTIGRCIEHPAAARYLQRLQSELGRAEVTVPADLPAPARPRQWPINDVIESLEKSDTSYPASCFPEIGRFLYDFTRLTRPALVLETGTYIAYSALCIAQALEHNGHGHLHSFDIFHDHAGYVSPVLGPCRDALQVARAHAEKADLAARITFHKGDSSAAIRRVLGASTAPIDLAFVDADHTISGCLLDWNAIAPLIRPGGFVILHDIRPDKCGWLGPGELLDRLQADRAAQFQQVRIPSPEGFGLGILQKQGDAASPIRFSLGDLLRDRLFAHQTGTSDSVTWAGSLRKWLRQRKRL